MPYWTEASPDGASPGSSGLLAQLLQSGLFAHEKKKKSKVIFYHFLNKYLKADVSLSKVFIYLNKSEISPVNFKIVENQVSHKASALNLR